MVIIYPLKRGIRALTSQENLAHCEMLLIYLGEAEDGISGVTVPACIGR